MSWVTDQISAGAAGQNVAKQLNWTGDLGNPVSFAQLSTILEGNGDQFYLQKLPENDGWGHPLEFRAVFDPATASTFSNLIRSSRAIGIRSTGRSGLADGNVYTNGIFPSATYNCDIVWSDGYFVRIPGGVNASSSSAPSKKSQKAPDC